MKKIIVLSLLLAACNNANNCSSIKCQQHIKHYIDNYNSGNTISFGKDADNQNYKAPHKMDESRKYDVDDFRAGARHVCGAILDRSGKDVCREVGYTALY